MENYYIEEETGNYQSMPQPKVKSKKTNSSGSILLFLLIIAIIIIFVMFFFKKPNNETTFSTCEQQMLTKAKEYVNNNSITTEKEIYFDAMKLGVTLPNTCNSLSGVFYDGNLYKPYLLCNNYETKIIDNDYESEITANSDGIKLVGNNVIILLKGMEYYELGWTGKDNVTISGTVSDEGVSNIYYISDTNNTILMRKVVIVDNQSLYNSFPVINISGNNVINLEIGDTYGESATAIDSIDGDLTSKIIEVNNLDAKTPGNYMAVYYVRNSLGYITFAKKDIVVISKAIENDISITASLSNENITNGNVKIKVNIVGEQYKYTKLPNGEETTKKSFEYTASENGTYEFSAFSKNDEEIKKTVKITNIDKTTPKGTCEAIIYGDHTNISVKVSTFNYIVGYNYYVNSKGSGYIEYSSYDSKVTDSKDIYVMAKDYIGNKGKITCKVVNKKSSLEPDGIRTVISGKARLRISIVTALANKGYTVSDLNSCIYKRVVEAGPYTRYGVAAAAFGLIDCMYSMTGYVGSYNHTDGKVEGDNYCRFNSDICGKLGINTNWGNRGGTCGKSECWRGLNCATFVRWSMCNGGMDLCSKGSAAAYDMTSTKYFPEADGVSIKGSKVTYYSGKNLTGYSANELVRMLKPGDAIASSEGNGHTFLVVGRDDNGIYTAEDGYYMRNIKYSTLTNGAQSYRLLFLDNYYANTKNRNNLYN